jgi:hypothetical protein
MTEHPWASRAPIAWLLANELGATAVVGFLLTAGVALPPILPVMLAGASAVATRSARRLAVDPLADAMTGIRRDLAPFLVLTLAVALVAAVPAWLALAIRGDDGLNAGFRLALVALPALTAAPLLFGAVIASATQTRALMVPAAGLTLALSSVRTSCQSHRRLARPFSRSRSGSGSGSRSPSPGARSSGPAGFPRDW